MARTSANTANTKKKKDKDPSQYQICIKCDKEKKLNSEYYSIDGDLYKNGKHPVCKNCLTSKLPPADPNNIDYIEGIKKILGEINRPFVHQLWLVSIDEAKRRNWDLFGVYMKNVSLPQNKHLTFKDSDEIGLVGSNKDDSNTPLIKNAPLITSNSGVYENNNVVLTDEDIQSQKDCLRLLGYDPFDGYLTLDRKFMYAELIPYLDEDTLEDQHKISIIIQLINNNSQIRKMDLLINKLSSDDQSLLKNNTEIKNLTGIKKQISDNNDKLAKENAIAIKHRGDKKAGRSTLGYLMKDLRELGFDAAEEDYYDMKKAYGMQMTAEISSKAIISQLNFDEKDTEDIIKEQRTLITELQQAKEELEEKLRLANLRINELRNKGDLDA